MRKIILITAMMVMVYPLNASALTGLSLGAKVGFTEYSGDVLPGSGDVGSGTSYGIILGIGTLPVLDFEIRGGYFTREFSYTYDAGGVPTTVPFEFQDYSMTAVLRKNLFAPPMSPFGLYIGAGAGMHWLNTEVANNALSGQVSTSPTDAVNSATKFSGEGILGLRLGLPAFPLKIFGEGRYGMIFASEQIIMSEFAAGLILSF
jgi:hypothetical protein